MLDTQGDVKSGWDFSLVKIAIALFCYGICIVSDLLSPRCISATVADRLLSPLVRLQAVMQVKLLYTAYVFDWGYQENSMLLSYISISRVVVLLAVLPLFIKLLHKKAPLPSAPRPESADTAGDSSILTAEQKAWEKEAKWLRTVHDARPFPSPSTRTFARLTTLALRQISTSSSPASPSSSSSSATPYSPSTAPRSTASSSPQDSPRSAGALDQLCNPSP